MQDKDIYNFFRERSQNLNQKPDDALWGKIETRLSLQSKSQFFRKCIFTVAAVSFIIGIILILKPTENTPKNRFIIKESIYQKAEKSFIDTIIAVDTNPNNVIKSTTPDIKNSTDKHTKSNNVFKAGSNKPLNAQEVTAQVDKYTGTDSIQLIRKGILLKKEYSNFILLDSMYKTLPEKSNMRLKSLDSLMLPKYRYDLISNPDSIHEIIRVE